MDVIERTIQVSWQHRVLFTDHLFAPGNLVLHDLLQQSREDVNILVLVDHALAEVQPDLLAKITHYFDIHAGRARLVRPPLVLPGGEHAKNSWTGVSEIHQY